VDREQRRAIQPVKQLRLAPVEDRLHPGRIIASGHVGICSIA
jgi:hypothetical protein